MSVSTHVKKKAGRDGAAVVPMSTNNNSATIESQCRDDKSMRPLTLGTKILLWTLVIFLFFSVAIIMDSFAHHQRDATSCRQSYLRPEFIKQENFDNEWTRFAGKFSLYLYREKGIDLSYEPTGVPVLFIPGHAGSYKQIRFIAAESAYEYYRNYAPHGDTQHPGVRPLDFFTVDFNEEFSALHGQSLLDQAEYINHAIDYILSLYSSSRQPGSPPHTSLPDPTSVIIVGHSMGGIVARTMFTLPNYRPGTINTIMTLSTPHYLPPVPFDWKISKTYDEIQQFWSGDYRHYANGSVLEDVSLISIAGGTLDNVVCSDSANVGDILPRTHGFTVLTSAVPHVWMSTDHNSIISCSQIVRVLSKSLLDIVDVRRQSQTKRLEERMQILRKTFLSGLEDRIRDGTDLRLGDPVLLDMSRGEGEFLPAGARMYLSEQPRAQIKFLPKNDNASAFSILSSLGVGKNERFDIMVCNKVDRRMRLRTRVSCRSAQEIVVPFPSSMRNEVHPFSGKTFSFASLLFNEIPDFDYLAVVDRGGPDGFLLAEAFDVDQSTFTASVSMRDICMHGVHFNLHPSLFSTIRIPVIESPMLAYHLKVSRHGCKFNENIFAPFMRQSIATMHESKFYVNIAGNDEETDVSIHGRAAFSPETILEGVDMDTHRGLELQFWMDPLTCAEPMSVDLSIDWYGSAGRIGFRNGVMLAAYSFVIVLLVFVSQIHHYNKTGIFPHFGHQLGYVIRRKLPFAMILLGLCTFYQATLTSAGSTYAIVTSRPTFSWHDILTGMRDPFFWWLPVVGLVISAGAVSLLWLLVEYTMRGLALLMFWCRQHQRARGRGQMDARPNRQLQRRVITTMVLFALVATCIPYQFVFVVAFMVQAITSVRSLVLIMSLSKERQPYWNRYHYMQSIFMLLTTLLPFNVPILAVWIKNLSVHWFVPFSSDHNIFSIAPFIIYVELLISHRTMLPRVTNRSVEWITYSIFYGAMVYVFMYCIKYTYSIYFVSNYLMVWLLCLHFFRSPYGTRLLHKAISTCCQCWPASSSTTSNTTNIIPTPST